MAGGCDGTVSRDALPIGQDQPGVIARHATVVDLRAA
jgi:hypothetical protein